MTARLTFQRFGLSTDPRQALRRAFLSKEGQLALDTALSELRKVGLASQVLDVSVCGAVEPYSYLLGGKLVAMLLASREVQASLDERYGASISEIASRLAGRPITRDTSVRVLTTTSLYGVGSSQYNRLKLRANDHRGIRRDLEWVKLGKRGTFEHEGSKGFGIIHLSSATSRVLKELSVIEYGAQRANNGSVRARALASAKLERVSMFLGYKATRC